MNVLTKTPPPKKTRSLINWEPSKAGRRALRDLRKITGWNQKTAIELSLSGELARRKAGAL